MKNNFNAYFENSFTQYWDKPALSDYQGETYLYKDVAEKIARLHILFQECGLNKGDKVSLTGRNSSHWGVSFLATMTYGAVVVPILHEFKPDNMHNIINHSESRILFVGDMVWESLSVTQMPELETIVQIDDFKILYSKNKDINELNKNIDSAFNAKYSKGFGINDIKYHNDEREEIALINYTSGTTGFSKGVMLPYRALAINIEFAINNLPSLTGGQCVSILPMAHMYGLMFEFLFEISEGCHITFLTRMPTPKIVLDSFANTKPVLIISVPLIIEKIYKQKVRPILDKPLYKLLLKVPILKKIIYNKILNKLNQSFGGNFYEIVVGGAAFNREAEIFFQKIGFRFTIGYGMTECAPLIAYSDWKEHKATACGKPIPGVEIKIDNPNPDSGIGEIMVKGDVVFLGYFKNQEATDASFDKDGWFNTGDLGMLDQDGYLYIKGRSKNMFLGPSGQNIYPEEIEDLVNNIKFVAESVVVEINSQIVALIYPDYEKANSEHLNNEALEAFFNEKKNEVNKLLPSFSQIAAIRIHHEEFEKTPKKSIKRFMYQ